MGTINISDITDWIYNFTEGSPTDGNTVNVSAIDLSDIVDINPTTFDKDIEFSFYWDGTTYSGDISFTSSGTNCLTITKPDTTTVTKTNYDSDTFYSEFNGIAGVYKFTFAKTVTTALNFTLTTSASAYISAIPQIDVSTNTTVNFADFFNYYNSNNPINTNSGTVNQTGTLIINDEDDWTSAFLINGIIVTGTIILGANISFSSQPNIAELSDASIFDGDNYILTFTYANHNGFIKLIADTNETATVQNVNIASSGSGTISTSQGSLCNVLTSGSETWSGANQITNCSYVGNVTNGNSGGLMGQHNNTNYTNLTLTNCFFSGTISNSFCGGLVGQSGGLGGAITFEKCYSIATLSSIYGGGLTASHNNNGGTITINNCFANVTNSVSSNGGFVGTNNTNVTINNSYVIGSLSSALAGSSSTVTVTTAVYVDSSANAIGGVSSALPNVTYDLSPIKNSIGSLPSSAWTSTVEYPLITDQITQINNVIDWNNINASSKNYVQLNANIDSGNTQDINILILNNYNVTNTSFTATKVYLKTGNVTINTESDWNTFFAYNNYVYVNSTVTLGANITFTSQPNIVYFSDGSVFNPNSFWINLNNYNLPIVNDGGDIDIIYNITSESGWNNIFTTGTIVTNTTIYINSDISFSSQPNIPYLGDGAILDGNNYILTFTYANHNGFVKLIADTNETATVQNVNIVSSGAGTISTSQGGLCNVLTSGSETWSGTNQITNCSYIGNVANVNSGGLMGQHNNTNYTNLTLTNCYATVATISANDAGGLCGSRSGDNGLCTLTNCYAIIDTLSGNGAGGLCGSYSGDNGSCTLTNCYATITTISSSYAGGLCGYGAGMSSGLCTISNCYANIGSIGGSSGALTGSSSHITIGETSSGSGIYAVYIPSGMGGANSALPNVTHDLTPINASLGNLPSSAWSATSAYPIQNVYISVITSVTASPNTFTLNNESQTQDVTFTATVTNNGLLSTVIVEYNSETITLTNTSGNDWTGTKTFDYADYSYGLHSETWTCTTTDATGNETTADVNVNITKSDTVNPVIASASISPNNITLTNDNLTQDVTFTATITDDVALDFVTVSYNGETISLTNTSGNIWSGTKTFDYADYSYGAHSETWTFTATDTSENETTADVSVNITKSDTVSPTISSATASPNTFTLNNENQSQDVIFTVTVTDNHTVDMATVAYNGDIVNLLNTSGNDWTGTKTFEFADYTYGLHSETWTCTTTDATGNETTADVNVNITKSDTVNPVIASASISPNNITLTNDNLTQDVTFTATITDDVALDFVTVSYNGETISLTNTSGNIWSGTKTFDYDDYVFGLFNETWTFTATDTSGNIATQNKGIYVTKSNDVPIDGGQYDIYDETDWNNTFGVQNEIENATIKIMNNITFVTQPNVPILLGGAIFEGNNYNLTFTYSNHVGFAKLSAGTNKTATIQNINAVMGTGGSVALSEGGVCHVSASDEESEEFISGTNQIINCGYTGDITNRYSGGIIGDGYSTNYENLHIQNCSVNITTLSALESGGICGYGSGYGGICLIENCTSIVTTLSGDESGAVMGDVAGAFGKTTLNNCSSQITTQSGEGSGGIGGAASGIAGKCIFNNCTSEITTLSALNAGGITGEYSGYTSGSSYGHCLLDTCTSEISTLSGSSSGGLCGIYGGSNYGSLLIKNSQVNITTILDGTSNCGGIVGAYCGSEGTCIIEGCSVTCTSFDASDAGGISGSNFGDNNGKGKIINCYANVDLLNTGSGGMTGSGTANSGGTVEIYNCYLDGDIAGTNLGGCIGQNSVQTSGQVTVDGFYLSGDNTGSGNGGICATNIARTSISNCYVLGSAWTGDSGVIGTAVGSGVSIDGVIYCSSSSQNIVSGSISGASNIIKDLSLITNSTGALPTLYWYSASTYPKFFWEQERTRFTGEINISTEQGWIDFANQYNTLDGTINLQNNITFTQQPPLFWHNGIIDGRGYTITINYANHNGLFVLEGGTVKVVQIHLNYTPTQGATPHMIKNTSTINNSEQVKFENCCVIGDISNYTAGFINNMHFFNQATFDDCYFSGEIGSYSGGLITGSENIKCNCCFSNDSGIAGSFSGGLLGPNCNYCSLENCYFLGIQTGVTDSGGLIGQTHGSNIIKNCYSAGIFNSDCGALCSVRSTSFPTLQGRVLYNMDSSLAYGPNTTIPTNNVGNLNDYSGAQLNGLQVRNSSIPSEWDSTIWGNSSTFPLLSPFQAFPWNESSYSTPEMDPTISEGNCIIGSTMILTPYGEKRIDSLQAGELVVTGDNRLVPIISVQKYKNNKEEWRPFLVPQSSLGNNMPNRDLFISRFHAYKLHGRWRHFECNKQFNYAEKYNDNYEIFYYNLKLPNYHKDTFIANALEVESWDGVKIFEGNERRNYKWKCQNGQCKKIIRN